MKLKIIHLSLVIAVIFAGRAFSDEVEVKFSEGGRLFVINQKLWIQPQGEHEKIEVENVEIQRQKVESNGERNILNLLLVSDHVEVKDRLRSFLATANRFDESTGEILGVRSFLIDRSDGRKGWVVFTEKNALEFSNFRRDQLVYALRFQSPESNSKKLKFKSVDSSTTYNEFPRYEGSHFKTDEVGVVHGEETRFFAYDRAAGRLKYYRMSWTGSDGLSSASDTSLSPEDFPSGQDFEKGGKLIWNSSALQFSIRPLDATKPVQRLHVTEPRKEVLTDESLKKAGQRYHWFTTYDRIQTFLGNDGKPSKVLQATLALNKWLDNLAVLPQHSTQYFSSAFVTLPASSQNSPELVNSLLSDIVYELSDRKSAVIYVRPPSEFEHASLTQLIVSEIKTAFSNPSTESVSIVIDTSLVTSSYQGAGLSNVITELQSVSTMKKRKINLISTVNQNVWGSILSSSFSREPIGFEELLADPIKQQIIFRSLNFKTQVVSESELSQVMEGIKSGKAGLNPLANLDETIPRLKAIYQYVEGKDPILRSPSHIASMFRRLSNDRTVQPFPASAIRAAYQIRDRLSASSPVHDSDPLYNLDPILQAVQDRITTYESVESQKGEPSLVLVFMGEPGVGKTSVVKRLIPILDTEKEVAHEKVGFSQSEQKTKNFGSGARTEDLITAIHSAVNRLVLSSSPVKILELDEVHCNPEVLKELLAATGNGDSRGKNVLNLDGIIVILSMNVPKDSDAKKELTHYGGPGYFAAANKLFVDILSKADPNEKNARPLLDDKTAEALGSRLLSRLFFFKKLVAGEEAEAMIKHRVLLQAARHKIRLVTLEGAYEQIQERLSEVSVGNIRAAEESIDHAISYAISEYKEKTGRDLVERETYLLHPNPKKPDKLNLILASTSPESSQVVLEEDYRRTLSELILTLERHVAKMTNEVSRLNETSQRLMEIRIQRYTAFAEGLKVAAKSPLFKVEDNHVVPVPFQEFFLSDVFNDGEKLKIQNFLRNEGKRLLRLTRRRHEFLNREHSAQTELRKERIEKAILNSLASIFQLVSQIETQSQNRNAEERSEWDRLAAKKFMEEKLREGLDERRAAEIDFMEGQLAKWKLAATKLEAQPLELDKVKIAMAFGTEYQTSLAALQKTVPKLDLNLLKRFLDSLSASRSTEEAEKMIEERKSSKQSSIPLGGSADSGFFVEGKRADVGAIVAGFLVDATMRTASRQKFNDQESEREARDLRAQQLAEHQLRQQAAALLNGAAVPPTIPPDADCLNAMTNLGKHKKIATLFNPR